MPPPSTVISFGRWTPKYIHANIERRSEPCRRYTANECLPSQSRYLLDRKDFAALEKWIPSAMKMRPMAV